MNQVRARAEYDQLLAEVRGVWNEMQPDEKAAWAAVCVSQSPLALMVIPPALLHGLVRFAIVSMMVQEQDEC